MTIFGNDKPRWVHGLFVMKKEGVPNNSMHSDPESSRLQRFRLSADFASAKWLTAFRAGEADRYAPIKQVMKYEPT